MNRIGRPVLADSGQVGSASQTGWPPNLVIGSVIGSGASTKPRFCRSIGVLVTIAFLTVRGARPTLAPPTTLTGADRAETAHLNRPVRKFNEPFSSLPIRGRDAWSPTALGRRKRRSRETVIEIEGAVYIEIAGSVDARVLQLAQNPS
ncbi:hypothetical protein ACWDKQ_09795 [Saccharopolyspora sp. NPDC000995]